MMSGDHNSPAPLATDQHSYSVFRDGAAWCATASGFVNLQESPAGFGESPVVALGELIVAEQAAEAERWKTIRRWKCNNCLAEFQCRHAGDGKTPGTGPACIRCKAYGQYTFEVLP